MKVRNTESDPRKNPDSSRVHGLRDTSNSSFAPVKEINRTDDERNEASSSLPWRVRTFELPLPEAGRHRTRGKWSVSPLWEAKILLGVLKQQGLVGKGLVEAFEKWAPRIAGSSRADMSRLYRAQTGRELSDYILVQQADKVVRYNQLPPDAEVVRRALRNSCSSPASEATSDFSTRLKACLNLETGSVATLERSSGVSGIAERRSVQPREAENVVKKREMRAVSKQHLLDSHDPNVLMSTNELATLIGFKPKTIRRWVSRKLLNYIRVGNRLRFRLAAVELFLAQREVRK
jgi:excisionase family DNA binding protein